MVYYNASYLGKGHGLHVVTQLVGPTPEIR
jgi:hypothetical protein